MTTISVKAGSLRTNEKVVAGTIEVELAANAAGRVIMVAEDGVRVELTDLTPFGGKITDAVVIASPLAVEPCLEATVTVKQTGRKGTAKITLADKPLYRELYDAALDLRNRIQQVLDEFWARERGEIESSNAAAVPAGMVALRFSHSEADGWVQVYTDAEGRTLRSPKIAGERGSVAWITPEDHAAAVAEIKPETPKAEAAPVREIPVDVAALATRYGTADAAWEAEDEQAWAALKRYGF